MNELKKHLYQILEEIEKREGITLESEEWDYLSDYFQSLNRMPGWIEVLTYAFEKKWQTKPIKLIEGHKTDAFYPRSNVMDKKDSDSLAIPYTLSDLMKSKDPEDKVFDEFESMRARNLRAVSLHLPREVLSVIEDQYLVDNFYTDKGYHHYQHEEGKTEYLTSFNLPDLTPVLSSKAGFNLSYGANVEKISDFSLDKIRKNNENGFPIILSFMRPSESVSSLSGGFANSLPSVEENEWVQAGDLLVLLGDSDETGTEYLCQSVIFNAYALDKNYTVDKKYPISQFVSLESQSLSSAVLQILSYSAPGCGIHIKLPNDESPEEFWLRPKKNSYLLVIPFYQRHVIKPILEREACRYKKIGVMTELGNIVLQEEDKKDPFLDIPYDFFTKQELTEKSVAQTEVVIPHESYSSQKNDFSVQVENMLSALPNSDKSFWVTQMDRSSTGCVTRDMMVGPWQVPVANIGVTVSDFKDYRGEAIALGECSSWTDLSARVQIALSEAITNMAAAAIEEISNIHLSIPQGYSDQCYEILKEMCLDLEISWEVLPMKMAPKNPVVLAFSPIIDVRKTLTPQLVLDDETELLWISLKKKGSTQLKLFFKAIQTLNANDLLLAYHDISTGGLILCLLEIAFTSKCGLSVNLPNHSEFKQIPGAVIQVRSDTVMDVMDFLERCEMKDATWRLGKPVLGDEIVFYHEDQVVYSERRTYLHRIWSNPGYEIQKKRMDEVLAQQEYDVLLDELNPGLHEKLTFDSGKNITLPYISEPKPPIAILRFPGSSGHLEMAAACDRVGFECMDVQITDILRGYDDLKQYAGLAVGGSGWDENVEEFSRYVLDHPLAYSVFAAFFKQQHTFTLGTGCGFQWLIKIKSLIPGTQHWPILTQNVSKRFESRWSLIKVQFSSSIFLKEMENSFMPLPVVSLLGRVEFPDLNVLKQAENHRLVALSYTNPYERVTENYPFNPTGSQFGICGLSNQSGNVLGMTGHPERACRTVHQSWHYRYLQVDAPWLRLFRNARLFVGSLG